MLRVIALVVPLSLDTFAVAAAVGMSRLTSRQRLRISMLFALFEGTMPLVGFLIGAGLGRAIGHDADYLAGLFLIGLGCYGLWPRDESGELATVTALGRTHGLAVVGLGIGISLDELAIGFSAGLLRIPIILAAVLIAAQAFAAAQLGVRLGQRVGEGMREGAEKLASAVLVILGLVFVTQHLA
jgi:manganese efflux pump family protein